MKECRVLRQNIEINPIQMDYNGLINKSTKVFTIGSCFALEIKDYLIRNGYNVLVNDENRDTPEPKLIWYNSHNILYEFERLTGEFVQDVEDIWFVNNKWQDPYRRCLFANTKEELWEKIKTINKKMEYGILNAELLIITLGLTEVFFQKNGKAICASPGYANGGGQNCDFVATKFDENYNNIKKVFNIVKKINPNCKIVLTVSPVPLGSTFRGIDHLVANTESKSILRSVAGQISEEFENVFYFHSYEIANNYPKEKVFIDDARHVKKEFVSIIMDEFKKYFIK